MTDSLSKITLELMIENQIDHIKKQMRLFEYDFSYYTHVEAYQRTIENFNSLLESLETVPDEMIKENYKQHFITFGDDE